MVKESIINNSDCKILLDQRKYMNKFDSIQFLLALTEKGAFQMVIFFTTIKNAPNLKRNQIKLSLQLIF